LPLYDMPLSQVTGEVLTSLVADEVREDRQIEYKEELPATSPRDKMEFLGDVSAFANTIGGDVVYGVREKRDDNGQQTGIPEEICGLEGVNLDALTLRLDSILRDGLDPRLPPIQYQVVPVAENRTVVILRVPRSWRSPHMIRNEGWFYGRSSAGKFRMDVLQLREAFLQSELTLERARGFRHDRLDSIERGDTPVPLPEGPKIALHIVPLTAFDARASVDVHRVAEDPTRMMPIFGQEIGWGHRYNFDGFLTFRPGTEHPVSRTYTQLFRTGAIEATTTSFFDPAQRVIYARAYEPEIVRAVERYLNLETMLGVGPPLVVMLSLVGVRGYTMWLPPDYDYPSHGGIERDTLVAPEQLVEELSAPPAQILRRSFDAVWNACGYPRSLNYDENGEWKPRQS